MAANAGTPVIGKRKHHRQRRLFFAGSSQDEMRHGRRTSGLFQDQPQRGPENDNKAERLHNGTKTIFQNGQDLERWHLNAYTHKKSCQ